MNPANCTKIKLVDKTADKQHIAYMYTVQSNLIGLPVATDGRGSQIVVRGRWRVNKVGWRADVQACIGKGEDGDLIR